jgi:cell division protein FtsN
MAMAIGLLTFCFVIGVQVGKRSLTQKNVRVKTLDEELNELPEPLNVQLELFQAIDASSEAGRRNERQRPTTSAPATDNSRSNAPVQPQRPATAPETAAAEPPKPVAETSRTTAPATTAVPTTTTTSSSPAQTASGDRWTAQILATRDVNSANGVSNQLRSQGMPAKVVSSPTDGWHRVQLDWSGTRAEADSRISRLKALGYNPIAVRIQ